MLGQGMGGRGAVVQFLAALDEVKSCVTRREAMLSDLKGRLLI